MKRLNHVVANAVALAVLFAVGAGPARAGGKYDTGADDKTIKIGQTYP